MIAAVTFVLPFSGDLIAIFAATSLLIIAVVALFVVKRLYFHPLSEYPGPRLAALTTHYRAYFEVRKGGGFLREINRLHAVYGPIIRIAPNELHFSDRRAFFDIYSVGSHLTKDPISYRCFAVEGSAFGAVDPQTSKFRRGLMHSVLSRRSVLNIEGLIGHKTNVLIAKLTNTRGRPFDAFLAFRSASLDIITSYMFGRSFDTLNYPNFDAPLVLDIQNALPLLWTIKSFPWMIWVLSVLPRRFGGRLSDQFAAFLSIKAAAALMIKRTKQQFMIHADSLLGTIYYQLQNSEKAKQSLGNRHASSHCLLDESLSLLQAGSDTVGNTCTVGTFHILKDSAIHSRLVAELRAIWVDETETVSLESLQSSPYLTAVIKESLRLSHGIITPLPRVVGPAGAVIANHHIPPETIVGMSVTFMHLNPDIFPNPEKFDPTRWLSPSSEELNKYLVPFSAGPRMCLGVSYHFLTSLLHTTWTMLLTVSLLPRMTTTTADLDYRPANEELSDDEPDDAPADLSISRPLPTTSHETEGMDLAIFLDAIT